METTLLVFIPGIILICATEKEKKKSYFERNLQKAAQCNSTEHNSFHGVQSPERQGTIIWIYGMINRA